MGVNEFSGPMMADSRLHDTAELTDNDKILLKAFVSVLGLDYNKDGELIRRSMKIKDDKGNVKVYYATPLMSYEGAIRLIDTILTPFLSNLAGFTTLKENDVYRITRSFADELVLWLYKNREEFDIDTANIRVISSMWPDLVFLQLSRSREGDGNLMGQVMGNTSKQYVYRGDLEAQQYDHYSPQPKRSIWNLGGLIGGR